MGNKIIGKIEITFDENGVIEKRAFGVKEDLDYELGILFLGEAFMNPPVGLTFNEFYQTIKDDVLNVVNNYNAEQTKMIKD